MGDGRRTFFWTDKWVLGRSVENIAPEVFHAVNPMIRATRTVAEGLPECNWIKDIKKQINIQTFLQAVALWEETRSFILNPGSEDAWTWTWEPNGIYTAKSVYAAHFAANTNCEAAKAIWESRAPLKIKFFAWLLFRRRVWTADRLAKRGLPHNPKCVFCNAENETVKHLFMNCAVINILWCTVLGWARLNHTMPRASSSLNRWWLNGEKRLHGNDRKKFLAIFMLVTWTVWCERNKRVFDKVFKPIQVLDRKSVV